MPQRSRLTLSVVLGLWVTLLSASPASATFAVGTLPQPVATDPVLGSEIAPAGLITAYSTIAVAPEDVGKPATVYVAVRIGTNLLFLSNGAWVSYAWQGPMPAYHTGHTLATVESTLLVTDVNVPAGTYGVFSGYQVPDGPLKYGGYWGTVSALEPVEGTLGTLPAIGDPAQARADLLAWVRQESGATAMLGDAAQDVYAAIDGWEAQLLASLRSAASQLLSFARPDRSQGSPGLADETIVLPTQIIDGWTGNSGGSRITDFGAGKIGEAISYNVTVTKSGMSYGQGQAWGHSGKKCPDSQGKLLGEAEWTFDITKAVGSVRMQGSARGRASIEGHVGVDAKLSDYDIDFLFQLERSLQGGTEYVPTEVYLVHIVAKGVKLGAEFRDVLMNALNNKGIYGTDPHGHTLGWDEKEVQKELQAGLKSFVMTWWRAEQYLKDAEKNLDQTDDACVTAEFDPKSASIRPGESKEIQVTVRHKETRAEIETIVNTRADYGSVSPTQQNSAPGAPARFTFTAQSTQWPEGESPYMAAYGTTRSGRFHSVLYFKKRKPQYTGWARARWNVFATPGKGIEIEHDTQVTFEMEDQKDGMEVYRVKEGTMVTTVHNLGPITDGCRTSSFAGPSPLPATLTAGDAINDLYVDLADRTYMGMGVKVQVVLITITTTNNCHEPPLVNVDEIPIGAGTWLYAGDPGHLQPFSDIRTLAGRYEPPPPLLATWEWELTRVEEEP